MPSADRPLLQGWRERLPLPWVRSFSERRGPGAESCAPGRHDVRSVLVGRCLDGLVERQLATLDRVDAVVREGRVTVLVDGVGTEHARAILRLEDRLEHVLLRAGAGALDRVQRQAHGLVAVDGVRVRVLLAVLLLEVGEELLALLRVLVRREGRDRHLDLGGDAGGDTALLRVREPGLGNAVRPVELGLRHGRLEVLVDLDRVVGGDARVDHAVRAGALGLGGQRAVVRRVLVDRLVGDHLEALLLRGVLDVPRQAGPVDLLVVEDLHLGAAVLLHERRESGALDGVLRDDAGVRALAARVVLVRLARLGARLVGGESHGRVGRGDLRDARLVEDRDRDRRAARVELAEVHGGAVVLSRLAGVGGDRLRSPRAGLGRRVVERLVVDGDVAGLAADLLQRQLDAVHHGRRLRAGRALQRQGRVDGDRAGGLAATAAATAALIVVAARGYAERKRGDKAARRC